VFQGYYRNSVAAMEAFASDGWFRTGDLATLDASGHFLLAGRSKGFVNINSVKFETADVRMAGHLQPSSAHQAWHAAAQLKYCVFSIAATSSVLRHPDSADSVESSGKSSGDENRTLSRSVALSQILDASFPTRLGSLGLTPDFLARWCGRCLRLIKHGDELQAACRVRCMGGWMCVFHDPKSDENPSS